MRDEKVNRPKFANISNSRFYRCLFAVFLTRVENVVALTSEQTFPALTEESSSSPPTQSPIEEICDDGLDNDGDGATDTQDTDCEKAPPPLEDSEPLEQ